MSDEKFLQADKITKQMSVMALIRKLWPYLLRQKSLAIISIVTVIGYTLVGRTLPRLIGYAIDEGIIKKQASVIVQVAYLFLIFECGNVLLGFLNSYLFSRLGNRLISDIRRDLVQHLHKLPIDYFNRNPSGRIINRLTHDVASLSDLFSESLVSLLVQGMVIISIVIAMALISIPMTLVTIALTPVFILISHLVTKRIRIALQEQKKAFAEVSSFVTENLNGHRIIQIFAREERNQNLFQKSYSTYNEKSYLTLKSYALMQPVLNLLSATVITSALLSAGYASHTTSIALGLLVSFILYSQDVVHPIREILERWQSFQNSLSSADRVFQFFDESIETPARHESIKTPSYWGPLEFRTLRFQYQKNLPPALDNFDLLLERGKSLALVGKSGSGKTTLTSLLQRLYPVERNQIFIGGVDICDIPLKKLRQAIGIIQQDNFIFKGSIAYNVTLGAQGHSDQKIVEALGKVGLWSKLNEQGRGLDFEVEEKGTNLSAGERQLLAFSRVLLLNPEILILDEATANIDSESEKLIQDATAILMKDRTSIIVAHRLSTIQNCDLIVALKDGKIQEKGSHSELMAAQGYYHQLAEAALKSTDIEASAEG